MSDDLSEDAAEFRCLVPFPDQSHSFTHGFEAGMVWQRMVSGETEITSLIAFHAENRAVFQKMADAQGYEMIEEADNGEWLDWIIVIFRKRPKRFGVIEGGKS